MRGEVTITEIDYCPLAGDRPDDDSRPGPEFAWSEELHRARKAAKEYSESAGKGDARD